MLPGHDLVQPLADQLLRPGLLPDPPLGGAVHHFAGAVGEPPPAPPLQLAGLLKVVVVTVEGGDELRDSLTLRGGGQQHRVLPGAVVTLRVRSARGGRSAHRVARSLVRPPFYAVR